MNNISKTDWKFEFFQWSLANWLALISHCWRLKRLVLKKTKTKKTRQITELPLCGCPVPASALWDSLPGYEFTPLWSGLLSGAWFTVSSNVILSDSKKKKENWQYVRIQRRKSLIYVLWDRATPSRMDVSSKSSESNAELRSFKGSADFIRS